MLNALKFDSKKESRDSYLSRMSKVADSIRHGVTVDGVNYQELLSKDEREEFENYLFEIMLPVINREGAIYIQQNKLSRLSDKYMNYLMFEVWKNFHKFNNEDYKGTEGTCAFSTFVKVYTKDPARTAIYDDNGYSKHIGYKIHIIRKTIRYTAEHEGKEECNVSAEEVQKNMPHVSVLRLSITDIMDTMEYMQSNLALEDYMEKEDPADCFDQLVFPNEINMFIPFVQKLRPLQRFIFCQNFGFCSEKYDDISIYQLVCDPDFLKLVKEDHIGARHITKGDVYIELPRVNGFEVKDGPWDLKDIEHIDVNFVTHQRVRCIKLIKKFVQENGFDEYDVRANLVGLLRETWDDLSKEYGLN